MSGKFAEMTISTPFRDLLHAAKLRHVTDGLYFSSEGRRAEDFFSLPTGLNPRTWPPMAARYL